MKKLLLLTVLIAAPLHAQRGGEASHANAQTPPQAAVNKEVVPPLPAEDSSTEEEAAVTAAEDAKAPAPEVEAPAPEVEAPAPEVEAPAQVAESEDAPSAPEAPELPVVDVMTAGLERIQGAERRAKTATCRLLNNVPENTTPNAAPQAKVHHDTVQELRLSRSGVFNFSNAFDLELARICNDPEISGSNLQEALFSSWQATCDAAFRGFGQRVLGTNRAVYGSDLFKCRRAGRAYGQMAGMYFAGHRLAGVEAPPAPPVVDCSPGVSDSHAEESPADIPVNAPIDSEIPGLPEAMHI